MRQPPPGGIAAIFFTSTWMSSPGPFPLVAATRLLRSGGSVTTIEPAQPGTAKNALRRRGGDADLVRDAVRAPPSLAAQPHHLSSTTPARSGSASVRRGWSGPAARRRPPATNRSRHLRTVLASTWNRSAVASTVQPFSEHTLDHPPATIRGQHRVRMLASSVNHEPSWRDVSCRRPTTSSEGSLHWRITQPIPPGTTSPLVTLRRVPRGAGRRGHAARRSRGRCEDARRRHQRHRRDDREGGGCDPHKSASGQGKGRHLLATSWFGAWTSDAGQLS